MRHIAVWYMLCQFHYTYELYQRLNSSSCFWVECALNQCYSVL